MEFLYEVLLVTKKTLATRDVIQLNVPKYWKFTLKGLLEHVKEDPEFEKYLFSDLNEKTKLNRMWVWSVTSTLREDFVRQNVNHAQD